MVLLRRTLLVSFLLLSFLPLPTVADSHDTAADAVPALFAALQTAAQAWDVEDADAAAVALADAAAHLDSLIAAAPHNATAPPPEAALEALSAEDDGVGFRTARAAFEAAYLSWAAACTEAAYAAEDPEALALWLGALDDRLDAPGRWSPAAALRTGLALGAWPHARDLQHAVDATLAFRYHEEVQAALGAARHGDVVDTALARQAAFWSALQPRAEAALEPLVYQTFAAAVDDLPQRLRDLDPEEALPLPELYAPLAALEFHRSVERLDEVGTALESGLFHVRRTIEDDPLRAPLAWERIAAGLGKERQALILMGEKFPHTLDDSVMALADAARSADATAYDAALVPVIDELRQAALLRPGLVLKVEHGALQPDRVHVYKVTLLRAPLEGLASYQVRLGYDPSVVTVHEVVPLQFENGFHYAVEEDAVAFGGNATRFTGGAIVAHLRLEAAGPPAASAPLPVLSASFLTTDDREAMVHFLRDGAVTVAEVPPETQGDSTRDAPVGPVVLSVLVMLALAIRLRRPPRIRSSR